MKNKKNIIALDVTEKFFTKHGLERLMERVRMQPMELIHILFHEEKYIPVGIEQKKKRRHHCLFYSQRDRQCFVAVVDYCKQQIITILPVDYHQNICWTIHMDTIQDAISLHSKSYEKQSVGEKVILFEETACEFCG
jgi:hypothetical protein